MMNELTNWDDYCDFDEDEAGEDIYSCQNINETTKKLLLRKYMLYVKDSVSEIEVSDIMTECRYKDDEIKKKIDEKMSKFNARQSEWKLVSRDNRDSNREFKENRDKKFSNGPKQVQNVNNVYLKSSGEFVNNQYNNLAGNKNIYNRNNGMYNYNNEDTDGFKTVNKKFNKKISNQNTVSNNSMTNNNSTHANASANGNANAHNFLNNNYSNSNTNSSILKCPSKLSPLDPQETDIDHYFNAALNINKVEVVVNKKEKDLIISTLTAEDIKEFVEEIKKNKMEKSRTESFTCGNKDGISPNHSTNDISKIELSLNATQDTHDDAKYDTSIINELKEEEKIDSKEGKDNKNDTTVESEYHLEYDITKIPGNFLNANNYSNYFYQTGNNNSKKDHKDHKEYKEYKEYNSTPGNNINTNTGSHLPNFNKNASSNASNVVEDNFMQGGYVNMKMSMNMTMNMNMKMYPGMQGYYNPMFMPNMGFPVFYGMDPRMDPRMGYPPYFNGGMYPPQPFGSFGGFPHGIPQGVPASMAPPKEQKK